MGTNRKPVRHAPGPTLKVKGPAKEVALFRLTLLLLLAVFLPATAPAAFDPALLEKVSRAYSGVHAGLNTYEVDLETDRVAAILSLKPEETPAAAPRPQAPKLRKYWSRHLGAALIRVEGQNVDSAVQKAVERFSGEMPRDLGALFLPMKQLERRRRLLQNAEVKTFEAQLGDSRTLSVEIDFAAPTDLGQAFYAEGLDLPRQGVTRLTLDLDPDLELLRHLEITVADGPRFSVELRHRQLPNGRLPGEILITTPDGKIDDRFQTTFGAVDGFQLPVEQVRTIHRPGRQETIAVRFRNYRLNTPLSADIVRRMAAP